MKLYFSYLLKLLIVVSVYVTIYSPYTNTYAQNSVSFLNIRHFQSTMDAQSLTVTERSLGLDTGEINLSLMVDFALDPLQQSVNGQSFLLVKQLSSAQINLAFGLWGHLTIAISQPLHLIQGDLDGPGQSPTFAEDGPGDTHFLLKGIILDTSKSPVGVALLIDSAWAFASTHPLLSQNQIPELLSWLILDKSWNYIDTALNLGYAMRNNSTITDPIIFEDMTQAIRQEGIQTGAELRYRWGLAGKYIPGFFQQHLEVMGSQGLGTAQRAQNLELLTSLRLIFNKGSHLTVGASKGILSGYATPDWRFFMGITFHPKDTDSDQDGIIDSIDQCIYEKEDVDQFEDQDGCPDLDNDKDGIKDLYDQCPNRAEDFNKYEDEDGCPDQERDLDRDGIVDSKDECPNQAEDRDGFADQDGCPDEDNDNDQIPDVKDECPNKAEDFDSFEDKNGCPDEDNDQDGILDVNDRCPYDAEDKDGDRDLDGCPESAPSKVSIKKGKLSIKGKVYFKTAKAIIKSSSHLLLLEIAKFINEHPEIESIEIQGHTDARGRERSNQVLSDKRAKAVMLYLINEGSVNKSRLSSRGYGSSQPINLEQTHKAWAENRRVEFKLYYK
jgi:outer membrane protein OmpA-like peptidoglycan-associated protein